VTPATLQQTRIASCEDVQKEARRLIEIIRACFADLYPDDDACGAGRSGAAPGGPGGPDSPSSTDGGRRSRGDNGGGGAAAGGTVISGSGGDGTGTSGGGGGGGMDSGGQCAPGAGACSHWRAAQRRPGESEADAAARAAAARAQLAGLGRELLTFTSLGVG
jgi:hypothetical protein